MNRRAKNPKNLICLCNAVSQETIEAAIKRGCKTVDQIFDATLAGVGPCGGSCRPILKSMLESYLVNGLFPENPSQSKTGRRSRARRKLTNKF